MNSESCEQVRPHLMAVLDGESEAASTADRAHLGDCASCREWLSGMERLDSRLQGLAYPNPRIDLWTSLQPMVRETHAPAAVTGRLLTIGALVLAWRVLQLLMDLPFPALHPVVPMVAVAAALWQLAGDLLAVKTFAPELQKRGA